MEFTLRRSPIESGIYEIWEGSEVVKELAVSFKLYRWPSAFGSVEEIEKWVVSEEKKRVKNTAYRLLSLKRQSVLEITQKLERKGFSSHVICALVEECKELGYISDEECARALIEKEVRKGYGPRYIEMKLRSLGLETSEVRKIATEKVQRELIRKLKKSAVALQRRGFDTHLIFSELKNFLNEG